MRRPHVNHINVTLITLELSADVEKTDKKEHRLHSEKSFSLSIFPKSTEPLKRRLYNWCNPYENERQAFVYTCFVIFSINSHVFINCERHAGANDGGK